MTHLFLFLAATITLNITPGPDMLYVITRSIGQGRNAGLVSSLGIGVGCMVHTLLTAFGLAALVASSAGAFNVIKYLGAMYLIYLGIRNFFKKELVALQKEPERVRLRSIFYQGVITNLFNPKVAIFFLAFLPQFVDASQGGVAWQIVVLGCIFVVSGTICNSLVALLAGYVNRGLKSQLGFWRYQPKFTGLVFIALGTRIALLKRS